MTDFPRDKSTLAKFPAFRAQANEYLHGEKIRDANGPRAPLPIFVGQYQPSKGVTDLVRLRPGSYKVPTIREVPGASPSAPIKERFVQVDIELPFFPCVEHKDGRTKKTIICSAGPWANFRELREPCPACDLFWAEREENGGKTGRIGRRRLYTFSVFDYATYVKSPDTNPKARIDPKTGKPYLRWNKVTNKRDPVLNGGYEVAEGMVQHWALGKSHFAALRGYERQQIALGCTSCGTQDSLEILGYTCPSCGEGIIDMNNTHLTQEEIVTTLEQGALCPGCNTLQFPQDFTQCGKCERPTPATMFDVDMKVTRVITVDDKGEASSILQFQGYRGPAAVDERVAGYKLKPLDLIYAPTPVEAQLEMLQLTHAQWDALRGGDKKATAPAPATADRRPRVTPQELVKSSAPTDRPFVEGHVVGSYTVAGVDDPSTEEDDDDNTPF